MGDGIGRWIWVALGLLGSVLLGAAAFVSYREFGALNGLATVLPLLLVVLAIAAIMAIVSLWALRGTKWMSVVQLVVGVLVGVLGFGTYHPPILGPLLLGAGALWLAAAVVGFISLKSRPRFPAT